MRYLRLEPEEIALKIQIIKVKLSLILRIWVENSQNKREEEIQKKLSFYISCPKNHIHRREWKKRKFINSNSFIHSALIRLTQIEYW